MNMILSSGMHHHIVRFGICLIVVAFMMDGAGCGHISIEIRDWYDLDAVRDNMRGSYILMNDLDSTTTGYEELASPTANEGKGWQPIGSIAANDIFLGNFDGQGYAICDLFIYHADESDVGLFGVVGTGGVIENVGVANGNVTGYAGVGSVAGHNRGTVRNSCACGTVSGGLNIGSLVGVNSGTVSNSYSEVRVTGGDGAGGLVGKNEGTVSKSYCIGAVDGNDFVGDLVGVNGGTVSNCYTDGSVNGNDVVGGLVGKNEGTVSKCYSTGNVTGDEYTGGLIGQNLYGVVSNSFWDTQTSGQGNSDGGTGKTTVEMQDITTFTGVGWDMTTVGPGEAEPACTWNIVDDVTYPFLSWQPI